MDIKKRILIFGSVFSAGLFLAACGNDGSQATDDSSGEVRISWWGSDFRNEVIQEAINLFEEENPEITINAEFGGYDGYQERMTTQLAGGTAPDVIRLDSMWLLDYADQLTDLNELDDSLDLGSFSDDVLEPVTDDGKLLGLPLSTNFRPLFYNKTVTDEYGIEAPESWEDIIAMREVLPDDYYPMASPFGPRGASPIFFFSLLAQQTGQPTADENGQLNYTEDDFYNVIRFYNELVENRIMPSKRDVDNAGIVEGAPAPDLIEGRWVSFFEFTANTTTITNQLDEQGFELALSGYPSLEEELSTGVWTKPSMVYSIPEASENKEIAAKLMDFLMNDPEAIRIQGLENGVPDSDVGREIIEEEGFLTPMLIEAIERGEEKFDPDLASVFQWDTSNLNDATLDIITSLDYGETTVEEAAEALYNAFSEEETRFTN